ncbi:MAG: tail fiber domain-containing protein [Bacteroidota bacterium]
MKTAINLRLLGVLACCLIGHMMYAQSTELNVHPNEAQVSLNEEGAQSYQIDITGPDNYHVTYKVEDANSLSISPFKADGTLFANGSYQVTVSPSFRLTEQQQAAMLEFRQAADEQGLAQYIAENRIPTSLEILTYNFGILDGKFVSPTKHEGDMPPPTMMGYQTDFFAPEAITASINYFEVETVPSAMDFTMEDEMQVFTQDVIIQGSLCVGIDCPTTQSFGFDTQILKENNLRLFFDDTSASASFPSNDWRLVANESSNGGANYFAIEDATAGRQPFRIVAGAPVNSLWVDAEGDVGIGTPTPVLELHIRDGDSPTMRLEQDGSSGFGSQTWDVAGNETNFFVRDVTNGSLLPFKIKPSAPTNSLYIDSDGDIGIGTQSIDTNAGLHLESGNLFVKSGALVIEDGNLTTNGNARYFLDTQASFRNSASEIILRIDATNKRVGIGTVAPNHLLELSDDDAVKPNGGTWSAPSDRRLKTNIRDYEDGLAKVMAIRPVRYNYNGKMDMPTDKEFIGLIAQEIQEVAPYTVKATEGEDGYLFVDGTPLTYMLINAVQDQQEIINAQEERIESLEAQLSEVAQLREQVTALAKMLEAQVPAENATKSKATSVSRDRK